MPHALVRSRDVRRLWELQGQARELRGREAQKLHLVDGLMRIVGASVASMLRTAVDDDEQKALYRREHVFDLGWTNAGDRDLVFDAFRTLGWQADPLVRRVVEASWRAPGTVVARRCQDELPLRTYREAPIQRVVFERCRLDHTLLANLLFRDPSARTALGFGLGLKRAKGERPFAEEDRNLVELFFESSEWVWSPDPLAAESSLSRRERETLAWLVDGASTKEIAHHLGIGRRTVEDYVKAIHRAFGVRSRGELLARYAGQGRKPSLR